PLAILLSSLMTFGNFAENYELAAMKSAGLSLQRIMRPLTIISIVISLTAFYFSNTILPWANLKMQSMLFDISHSKPAINIKEGIFYNGINGYSIRVAKKSKDGKILKDVMIYDQRSMQGNNKVAFADSGKMEMPSNKSVLVITLYNGYSYEDMLNTDQQTRTRPLLRNKFKEQVIRFDLSDFKMNKTDESLFKTNYQMLNIPQLSEAIDSMKAKASKRGLETASQLTNNYFARSIQYLKAGDSLKKEKINSSNLYESYPVAEKNKIFETAINTARSAKTYIQTSAEENEINRQTERRFEVELHKKFTLSIACMILFFIGAPLGAIIRKGGLGMPVVVSVLFFIVFYIISIMGEKLSKEGSLPTQVGMWIAPVVLLPMGIFLTYKASRDSNLFDSATYFIQLKKFISPKITTSG
ncbi:MAG: LptF/LptG family permease, partial [Bacteroidia bacterium]|nr:LptF/LptG family permease [Bacteroidia bacterium]